MKVIDASALLFALFDRTSAGRRMRIALRDDVLAAPELIDLEVGAAIRRRLRIGGISPEEGRLAILDVRRINVARQSHRPLLARCWELRENVSFYDAAYVALAERLGAPLVTADQRLAGAAGPRCEFEVLG